MKILQYHPRVEVYVAVDGRNGAVTYYDLTEDLTSCSVKRNLDAPSTFSATFQNQDGKYNNLFSPMDRVVVRAGRDGATVPMFAGYINTVDRWRLFDKDFSMSGTDVLYRLKKTYVDIGLTYNSAIFAGSQTGNAAWGGYAEDVRRWMVDICGWPDDHIDIEALPSRVVEWAKGVYQAQREDMEGYEELSRQFREMLMTTGMTPEMMTSTGAVGGITGDPMNGAPTITSATGSLSKEKRQAILNAGYSALGTPYVFGGNDPQRGIDCSGFTTYCYGTVGITLPRTAESQGRSSSLIHVTREQLQPGDLVIWINAFNTTTGDHTSIYVGDNTIIHANQSRTQGNCVQVTSLDGWPAPTVMGYFAG